MTELLIVQETIEHFVFHIKDDLYAFQESGSDESYICKIKNLKQPQNRKKTELYLLSQEDLDGFATEGFGYLSSLDNSKDKNKIDIYDQISRAQNTERFKHLIKVDNSCHRLYDSDGLDLPVGIHIDYISANMNNYHYDLKKAVGILNKRKDIVYRNHYGYHKSNKPDSGLEILQIPYYNSDKKSNKYIDFLWSPSKKDINTMYDKCKSYGGEYPSTETHRAIFDLDLLGLRAGGAARFNGFYGESE